VDRRLVRRADRGALVLAALAGASLWISLGALMVISARGARLGAIAPPWLFPALVAAFVVMAWLLRLRTQDAWPLAITAVLWVPWLPVNPPAGLLAWEGPLETLIWMTSALGMAVSWLSRHGTWRERLAIKSGTPWIAGAVTLVMAITLAVLLRDRLPAGDEPHYLVITQSLLKDGDLRIQNNHDRGDYDEYFADGLLPDFLKRGRDGEIYSVHAPGVSTLVLPAFAIAGYPGAVISIAALCALGMALTWLVAERVTSNRQAAWAAWSALVTSAPLAFHSMTVFPDAAGAALMAVLLFVLVALDRDPSLVRRSHLSAAGMALATLPWLHTRFALLSALSGVIVVLRLLDRPERWRSTKGRALVWFGVPPLVSAIAWFMFFWVIYGTPNPAAPYGGSQQNSIQWIPNGLVGLAFDQQFGLLPNAPVMALVPYGLVLFVRSNRRLALELVTIAVPYGVVVASFGMWWGGWSAPARFLVCVLPFAAPALAYAWLRGGHAIRCAFVALTLIGAANVLARATVLDGALLYNLRSGHDVLLEWLSHTVNLSVALPSVHRDGWQHALFVGAIWFSVAIACVAFLGFALRRVPTSGLRWAVTSAIALGMTTVALQASWQIQRVRGLTPESSALSFVQRWRPDLRPLAVELPALRALPATTALRNIELANAPQSRGSPADLPLLSLARVPAGDYDVAIEGASRLSGGLTVSVGTTSQAIDTWSLDGVTAGDTGLRLHVPVLAHSVVIRGDATARSRIVRLTLRPAEVRRATDTDLFARRAARYGPVRAFFLDDWTYVEPGGFWTRGNSEARVVLVTDANDAMDLDLQAGPIASTVDLNAGSWSAHSELKPGERRRLRVPTGFATVRTFGKFRPVDYDRASGDRRPLGVRIEIAHPRE